MRGREQKAILTVCSSEWINYKATSMIIASTALPSLGDAWPTKQLASVLIIAFPRCHLHNYNIMTSSNNNLEIFCSGLWSLTISHAANILRRTLFQN